MQLPASLPDETLFSRYVRHMTILGMSEKVYLTNLFSKPRTSIHPYLTAGIRRAAEISTDSEAYIYRKQTLGRLFSYFLPQHETSIFQSLLQSNGAKAFRASQLVTFKESEKLSLKFCPLCAREDIRCYGVSYWHLYHQVSGVEACPNHKVWLIHNELPDRPHVKPSLLPSELTGDQKCSELSFQFAKFVKHLLFKISVSNDSFSRGELITGLAERGYVVGKNRFRRKKLTSDVFKFVQGLDHIHKGLILKSDKDYRYLSYLLKGAVCQHPFKYLLVLFWLNNNPNNDERKRLESKERKHSTEDKTAMCKSLLKKGVSLNEISRITGRSRCFLKVLAIKNNITVQLKPRVINSKIRNAVILWAHKGFHRKAIAKEFNISVGSVEQIISYDERLVEKRRQFKYESKRRRHKAAILIALKGNPSATRQVIKTCCYAAFYWLYVHERTWLENVLPAPTKPILRRRGNLVQ